MFSKWIIDLKGMENYRFGEDGNLYRLPFEAKNGKIYGLHKVAKDPSKKRWLINNERWSESQLRPHLIPDPDPIQLTESKDLPF